VPPTVQGAEVEYPEYRKGRQGASRAEAGSALLGARGRGTLETMSELGFRRFGVLLGLLLIAATASVRAEEQPYVYTNADLAKLDWGAADDPAPPPVTDPVRVAVERARWDFVQSFLKGEYARLDADRAHRLDRERAQAEQRASQRKRYSLAGYHRYWYYPGLHGSKRYVGHHKFPSIEGTRPTSYRPVVKPNPPRTGRSRPSTPQRTPRGQRGRRP